jgi:hypothetical protein
LLTSPVRRGTRNVRFDRGLLPGVVAAWDRAFAAGRSVIRTACRLGMTVAAAALVAADPGPGGVL